MTNNRVRSAVEELLAEGMAQMEAGITFAKAATDPLDQDFKGLNRAQQASDAADNARAKDQDGDETQAGEPGDGADDTEDDEDEDEENTGDEGDNPRQTMKKPAFLAKAEDGSYVDATPILEALDGSLASIRAENAELKNQLTTLAKSVQAQGEGVLLMAKAIAPNIDAPLMPKSKQARVTVPTAVTANAASSAQVFSKAQQALDSRRISPEHIALLEQSVQQYGVEGARTQIPHIFSPN